MWEEGGRFEILPKSPLFIPLSISRGTIEVIKLGFIRSETTVFVHNFYVILAFYHNSIGEWGIYTIEPFDILCPPTSKIRIWRDFLYGAPSERN